MFTFATTLLSFFIATQASGPRNTGVRRYAILFSADHGNAGEPQLRYTQDDVERVAAALSDVAGVQARDIIALKNSTATTVRDGFRQLRRRALEENHSNSESMLFVYYSGHADASTLHLNGTALPWEEVLQMVREVNVTARVVLMDACRSGVLTELKGLARDPEPVMLNRQELPKGIAIMTSASAGEVAQESPDIRGSFFTSHFVAALRGAADRNQDGRITLNEAYEYAAARTSQSTAATIAGVQHASYRFSLQGRHELVLSADAQWLRGATVRVALAGNYVFQRDSAEGPVVLEVAISGDRNLLLPSGTYYVRRRTINRLYKGKTITAKADGSTTTVTVNEVDTAPTMVSAKGGGDVFVDTSYMDDAQPFVRAWSLELFGGTGGSIMPQYRTPVQAGIMGTAHFDRFMLDLQLMYGYDSAQTKTLATKQSEVGAMVGVRYLILDGDVFHLSAGARAGAVVIAQQYGNNAPFANASQVAPEMQAVVRGEFQLPAGFYVGLEGSARGIIYKAYDNGSSASLPQNTHFSVALIGTLAVGCRW